MNKDQEIYDESFVRALFDEMAETYGVVNLISSFGFTVWWRRKCARAIQIKPGARILDMMAGMGELCTVIRKGSDKTSDIVALDLSRVMCDRAELAGRRSGFRVVEADALACPLEDSSVDCVFSSFGLKTFNDEQISKLASEVARVLRPGGEFSFLEVSVPPSILLRIPYMFYLNRIVPLIGRVLLGNPENYRMLGVYTSAFSNCDTAAKLFAGKDLTVRQESHFFGCATGFVGHKQIPLDENPKDSHGANESLLR